MVLVRWLPFGLLYPPVGPRTEVVVKRILMMDDDRELAQLLAFALDRHGYVVELAANGREALQRVIQGRFDVVLVDWNMPVMDGPEFLQEYRRQVGDAGAPIVVISAEPDVATQARQLGATRVLAKPFRLEELERLFSSLTRSSEP